jgi:hypothetical protein
MKSVVAVRVFFILVLIGMIAVTGWASTYESVWDGFAHVGREPWGLATLADAYFGFLTFYAWVLYRETSVLKKIVWLPVILFFGNIAMAIYVLILAFRVPANASVEQILLRRSSE